MTAIEDQSKVKKEDLLESNQNSAGAGEENNIASNIPEPSTSTRRPSTETNSQPTSAEEPSEMRRAREYAGNLFSSRPSKPTTFSSSANYAQGQPSHTHPNVPLSTHHASSTSTRRSNQQRSLRQHDTAEGVLISTGDDANMEDAPDPAPGGNKTTGEEPSSSSHASRSSRTGDETQLQLQLMQEKAKDDHRKELQEAYEKFGLEKSAWEKKQKELLAKIELDFQTREHNFIEDIEYYKLELNKQARKYKQQIDAATSQAKQFEAWNSQLKTKSQGLEQEKASYASQIEKMSQIVSQLSSKGLPLPPDDTYFTQELASLVSDIRAWARGFNKKRPALTIEEMNAIENNLPDEIKGYLIDSFHNFRDLLESGSVGTKLRTRCTEVILLRSLLSSYLHERYIGMDRETYATIQSIRNSLHASDQEIRHWSALTSHLYTKTNSLLDAHKDIEATQITEYLYTAISHFNDSPARTNSTEASLKKIVLRVAKLGMEIAQLPFCVLPTEFKSGCRFRLEKMDDIDPVDQDGDVDVNDDEGEKRTSIVLTPMWLKIVFDEEGRAMRDKGQRILLCKASVSCLT